MPYSWWETSYKPVSYCSRATAQTERRDIIGRGKRACHYYIQWSWDWKKRLAHRKCSGYTLDMAFVGSPIWVEAAERRMWRLLWLGDFSRCLDQWCQSSKWFWQLEELMLSQWYEHICRNYPLCYIPAGAESHSVVSQHLLQGSLLGSRWTPEKALQGSQWWVSR